jgi:hypothetical protein
MTTFVQLGLILPVLAALTLVFGQNVRRAMRTGVVWVRRTSFEREDDPTHFWVGVAFSTFFATVCAVGMAATVYGLVLLR